MADLIDYGVTNADQSYSFPILTISIYDTMLYGDGSNLSQGQQQLIAIARAAIAKPPVLILDEATSSIDTRTERLIEKGMDGIMEGRTVFVIAHRLSTVRNSNAIMVLERVRSWKEATMKNFWNRKADRVLEIFQMTDEIMKAGMTSEELETLEHILDKIEDNLNQAIEK